MGLAACQLRTGSGTGAAGLALLEQKFDIDKIVDQVVALQERLAFGASR